MIPSAARPFHEGACPRARAGSWRTAPLPPSLRFDPSPFVTGLGLVVSKGSAPQPRSALDDASDKSSPEEIP